MRRVLAVAVTVAVIGLAAPVASAYEFTPAWGYAFVDDNPFLDPANGNPLPTNRAVPRGTLQDRLTDGSAVRIKVWAFDANGTTLAYREVSEGNALVKSYAWDFNVGDAQIAYLRYDFCRPFGPNGNECLAPYRISRPAPPPPPPPPPPAPPPAPPAQAPVPSGGVQLPPARKCVAPGNPIRVRLRYKRRGGRAHVRIVRVVFFTKPRQRRIVDRRAPFRATLPVDMARGTRGRVFARVYYRVPGRRDVFHRSVSHRFRICD
jgi:hypothetical protein